MEKVIIELEAKTDKALKGIQGVSKDIENLNKNVTTSNKDTSLGLRGVEQAANVATKGIRSLGITLKAIGIGFLITSLATLKDMFSQNQKIVDSFNVVFETTANVVGQTITAFQDIFNALTKTKNQFDALGKVVSGIVTIGLAPLKNAFYGIKLALEVAQLAWEKSFFGDKDPETIKKLNESIIETKQNISDTAKENAKATLDIVMNFGEAVKEVSGAAKVVVKELGEISVSASVAAAKANVELKKSAELAGATQALLFEQFDRAAEKLRQVRDEERNSIEDRKIANDELLIKINAAEKGMLAEAKIQKQLADADLKKDINNTQFKVNQINAEKELAAVRAQIEGIRSEQQANDLALNRESIELIKSRKESEVSLAIQKKKFSTEEILVEQTRLQKLIEINESEKILQQERLQNIINEANLGTQAKVDAQIAFDDFTNTNNEENLTLKKDLGIRQVENARAVAEAEAGIRQGNLDNIAAGFALLSLLSGKNRTIQSAALIGESAVGIAKTVINTQAANSAATLKYALLPGGIALAAAERSVNNVNAGISIASNLAATAKGLGQLKGGGSAPSGSNVRSGSNSAIAPVPSLPPAFNVVGQSDTNQLADAIGGQSKVPQRAYVVSGDVKTSLELDRNIIKGASL
jgi:hypothetical protein